MTTTLVLRFPWGHYHATPWGRHVNEAAVEWPPSPWRILRALVATWKCRAPHLDEATVLALLDSLAEPPTYVVPEYVEAHTRHYMPDLASRSGPSRSSDKVIDAFTVFERDGEVAVTWPVDLPAAQRDVLATLAEALPYMGRAESICEARLADEGDRPGAGTVMAPLAAGEVVDDPMRVLVPQRPLTLKALIARTTEVRKLRLVAPPETCWQEYKAPAPVRPRSPVRPRRRPPATGLRWAVSTSARPSVRAAVTMTDVLRRACMARFGRLNGGAVSATLAGKDRDGRRLSDHRHAHYFALDTDGDRLVDTLVLWAPAGLDAAEVDAAASLSRLEGHGHVSDFRACRLGLVGAGDVAEVIPELVGPSRVWCSSTPFAPSRFGRRRQPWAEHVVAQISAELNYRGLPGAQGVELVRGDWLAFRRHRPKERLEDGRRAIGVRITFPDAVSGPLALGALSHFGLGLFVPK